MSLSKKNIVYEKAFLLSFKDLYVNECPECLNSIDISTGPNTTNNNFHNNKYKQHKKQHNSQSNSQHNSQSNSQHNSQHNSQPKKKISQPLNQKDKRNWEALNDIRTVCNSKNSFTNRMKDLSDDQRFIGMMRGLLNKITDKTYDKIKTDLEDLIIEDEYSNSMVEPIADIYIKKVLCDSVYSELYALSGILLCSKFNNLNKAIQSNLKSTFDELTKDFIIDDLNKIKLINIMKWIPYGCDTNVINWDETNNDIIENVCSKIKSLTEDEITTQSYASVITTEDAGVWVELACAILEVCGKCKKYSDKYALLLDIVVDLNNQSKKIKPRIKFMIEDVLEAIK